MYTKINLIKYKLFASKDFTCNVNQAVSNICLVDSSSICTFNITRSSLNLLQQEIAVQQLYWCTSSSNINIGTFNLYLVEINPRFYWPGQKWNITISDTLPVGSKIGYSVLQDCNNVDPKSLIVTNNNTRTYAWNDPMVYEVTLCAQLPTSSSS